MIRRLLNSFTKTQSEPVSSSKQNGNSFSNSNLSFLGWLFEMAPCFPINSNNIQIITEPKDFYNKLVEKSANARERITFASLYVGTGKLEQLLIDAILENQNLFDGKLKVNILLDFTRGSRGEKNSRTLILPLLKKYKNLVKLSLYHTPSLRGIYKMILPSRWNEIIGLQHMKVYIFDDSLIISGANLSNDYFTNRQDRYYMINDKHLADFYDGLVSRVQRFSFEVDDRNNIHMSKSWPLPYEGDQNKFITRANNTVQQFLNYSIEKQKSIINVHTDTWIFPLIEMGQLNIQNDSLVTKIFFSNTLKNSTICLATGYFNLTQEYIATIAEKCNAKLEVLMAHPNANGFIGARWPAGGIPYAYSLLARQFKDLLKNRIEEIGLYEYLKPGWTYHGKGLWYYLPNHHYPNVTFIGSPNFGERSVKRDLETQIILITTNKELSKKLHEECQQLYSYSKIADTDRHVPKWVKATVFIFRNFF